MAKNCCVCGAKIGFFTDEGHLGNKVDLSVCDVCLNHMNNMKITMETEDLSDMQKGRMYFNQFVEKGTENPEARELIREMCDKSISDEENNLSYHARKAVFKTTTGYNFEGYSITEYRNIVTGEVVLGTGFLSELSGQVNDFLGSKSGTFEGKIGAAKKLALEDLIKKALYVGANAIIGIDFDIMTLSSNMIAVSANGTAVTIEKNI